MVYGCSFGTVFYLWAPGAAQRISGQSEILLLLFYYIALILFFSMWPVLFGLFWDILKKRIPSTKMHHSLWLIPALWLAVEWLNLFTVPVFPWTKFQIGYRLAEHLYAIQLASVTGIWGVSLLVIGVNVLLAYSIFHKKIKWAAIAVFIVLLNYGYGVYAVRQTESKPTQQVRLAILQANISNTMEWNEITGDSLAQELFDLSKEALKSKPDIIVWSETVLPWPFSPDDNFLLEMLKITWPGQADQIMGMASPVNGHPDKITNSALYMHPDGRISGRYDKQALLLFMERAVTILKPLAQMQLPRYRIGIYKNVISGSQPGILETSHGTAGVRICNEWLFAPLVRTSVNRGASFLVNLSNNGDFIYKIMPETQFAETRIRAVENRRDVAIACNMGFSGHISRSGRILVKVKDKNPRCIPIQLDQNIKYSFYSKHGDWLPLLGLFSVVIFFTCSFIQSSVKNCIKK